mgnify:CR=1 FL=1
MKMIYKYPLGNDLHHNASIEVTMPRAAKILDIQYQADVPVLWAVVNPKKEKRVYNFVVFGTGFELNDYDKKHYDHIATVQHPYHSLTWHIFEVHE